MIAFACIVLAAVCTLPAFSQQAAPTGAQTNLALPPPISEKLDKLHTDLKAAQLRSDPEAEAATLNSIGDLYVGVSSIPQALENYGAALEQARAAHDPIAEAAALNGEGHCYAGTNQNGKAHDAFQQALDLARSSGDLRDQSAALSGLDGWLSFWAGPQTQSSSKTRRCRSHSRQRIPISRQSSSE